MHVRDRDRAGEKERKRETVTELVEEIVWGLKCALWLGLKTNLVNKEELTAIYLPHEDQL